MLTDCRKTIYIILILVFITSYIVHLPEESQILLFKQVFLENPIYSDIVNSDYKPIFIESCKYHGKIKSSVWNNKTMLDKYCRGMNPYPLPIKHYKYDKPPLALATFTFLTYITYLSTPKENDEPALGTTTALTIFYTYYSILVLLISIVFVRYLGKIYRLLGVSARIYCLALISPTILIYMIYGWDVFALTFYVLSMYYYFEKKFFKTYLFTGLFASYNMIGFVLIFLFLYNFLLTGKNGEKPRDLLGLLLGITPFIGLTIYSPNTLVKLLLWFNNEPCGNCIYLLLFNNIWSQVLRATALAIWVTAITIYLSLKPRLDEPIYRYAYLVLIIVIATLFNLSYPPQTTILFLPLLFPLYIIFHNSKPIIIHYLHDILNSLIIILWFKDLELRKIFSFMDLPQEYNPWNLESPVQWIAQIRNILLLIIIVLLAKKYLKTINPEEKKEDKLININTIQYG